MTAVSPDSLRLLVADDHVVLRQWLAMTLALEPDMTVVGEAADGVEAVEAAVKLVPDVVLMDLQMPRCSGVEACRQISEETPSVRVLIMTGSETEQDRVDSLRAGAVGFLHKNGDWEELTTAIRAAHRQGWSPTA